MRVWRQRLAERHVDVRVAAAVAVGVLAAASVTVGTAGWRGAALLALAAGVGVSFLLDVPLPWGGRVPVGHAVVIACTELLAPAEYAVVVGFALLGAWHVRRAAPDGREGLLLVVPVVAALCGLAGWQLFDLIPGVHGEDTALPVLVRVVGAGAFYLLADAAGRGRRFSGSHGPLSRREAMPVYISLLCAGALLALAYREEGMWAALIAAIPVLVTRFSFQRFSVARRNYDQTVQALSLLPEVGGLTPLGHAERTAVYASALAVSLGLDPDRARRVADAARLHHIGYISLHEPEVREGDIDPAILGRVGAEILRDTGFLADAADLVEEVHAARPGAAHLPAAVVRVASTLDDIVGDDAGQARGALLEVLARHGEGDERRAAIGLLQLCEVRPGLIEEAIRRGQPLTAAAAGTKGESSGPVAAHAAPAHAGHAHAGHAHAGHGERC